MDKQTGKDIIQALENIATDHVIIACTPTAAFIRSDVNEVNAKKVRGSYAVVKTLDDFQEIEEDYVKITVYDSNLGCFETVKKLTAFNEKTYMVASEAAWIDITNKGIHKGTTVQELQKILEVNKAETMVFGDGMNDVELMNEADYSFVMNHAFEETKNAANVVLAPQNNVLQAIEMILTLQSHS